MCDLTWQRVVRLGRAESMEPLVDFGFFCVLSNNLHYALRASKALLICPEYATLRERVQQLNEVYENWPVARPDWLERVVK